MPESKIIEIDFGSTLQDIVDIRKSIAELKKEREDLTKAVEEGRVTEENSAKAMAAADAAIRSQTKELRVLNNVIDQEIKQRKAQQGSIEANRAELSRLTAEYIKLGKPTKDQTDRIKALSDKLKEQEGAIGNTTRNVGNYGQAITGALKNVRLFGISLGGSIENLQKKKQELSATANSLGGVGLSLKGVTNGLKLFRIALISTGIGILIAGLGALVGLFLKSETGIELLNKGMTIFGAVMDTLVKRVEQFAKGVSFILNGDFKKGIDAVSDSFKGMGAEISKNISLANELADAQERLEDAEIGFIERRSKIRAQIQDLRDIANDETKAYQERKNALEEALILQAELTGREAEIAELRIENAEKEFLISAQTDDDRRKFEESKAAAFEDERSRTKEKIKLENELNTLTNKQRADQKAKDKEAQDDLDKIKNKQLDLIKALEKTNDQAVLDKKITDTKEAINAQITSEQEKTKLLLDLETFRQEEQAKIDEAISDKAIAELDRVLKHTELTQVKEIAAITQKYDQLIIAAGKNKDEVLRLEQQKQLALLEITRDSLLENLNTIKKELSEGLTSTDDGLLGEAILTEDAKNELIGRIAELETQLSSVNVSINNIRTNPETGEPAGLFEALGGTGEQQEAFEKTTAFIGDSINQIGAMATEGIQRRIDKLEEEKQVAIEAAGDNAEAREKIEKNFNAKIREEQKKQFQVSKAMQIVNAVIQTAQATIAAFSSGAAIPIGGLAAGPAFAAIAAALGAAQIAVISSQKFKEGGEVNEKTYDVGGKPHDQGGTKYFGEDGNVVEFEKGERVFVLKKTATDLINKYSMINQMAGGRSWTGKPVRHAAGGGSVATQFDGGFVPRTSADNVANILQGELLADAFRNMPTPVVRVTEINKVQRSVEQDVRVSEL